jgi:hypothetical protein
MLFGERDGAEEDSGGGEGAVKEGSCGVAGTGAYKSK